MTDDFNGEWLRRRSGRRVKEESWVNSDPPSTGPWDTPSSSLRARTPTQGDTRESPPFDELLHQHDTSKGEWISRHALCRKYRLSPETFYNRVVSGDVIFVRAGDRLLYKWVHEESTLFIGGSAPGDTDEMAARLPPQIDHVGALAALVDDLYVQLSDSKRENRVLQRARDQAETQALEATKSNLAMSNQVDEIERRSMAYQTSFLHTRRALYVSNAELRHRREEVNHLRSEIEKLSHSVRAAPIRKQLKALIDEE